MGKDSFGSIYKGAWRVQKRYTETRSEEKRMLLFPRVSVP